MFLPITPNIFFIQAPNSAKFPYCNGLFIQDKLNAIIDTSFGAEIIAILNQEGIDIVINSHFHEDHILNNNLFPHAQILVHEDDAPAVESLDAFLDYYGFKEPATIQLGLDSLEMIDLKPSKVTRKLSADEIIDLGKTQLQVIHTPGHTPGHCCFYEEKNHLLFLGDIDLNRFGPWYGHACSNIDDFIESINKCISINPSLVVTSHKGIITDNIIGRLKEFLDTIYIREETIIKTLAIPHTLDELTAKQIFYGPGLTLDPLYMAMEEIAISHHLKRLIILGQVRQDENLFYLS